MPNWEKIKSELLNDYHECVSLAFMSDDSIVEESSFNKETNKRVTNYFFQPQNGGENVFLGQKETCFNCVWSDNLLNNYLDQIIDINPDIVDDIKNINYKPEDLNSINNHVIIEKDIIPKKKQIKM